jgi:hypothetical protein
MELRTLAAHALHGASLEERMAQVDQMHILDFARAEFHLLPGQSQELERVCDIAMLLLACETLPCKAVNDRRKGCAEGEFHMTVKETQQCISAIGGRATGVCFAPLC